MKKAEHVFVYGTLMSGHGMSLGSDMRAELVGPDQILGTMFDINGSFPGISLEGSNDIQGELYKIKDHSLMARLDQYEGCNDNSSTSLYHRRVVTTKDGVETYVYEFNRGLEDYTEVLSGSWHQHNKGED